MAILAENGLECPSCQSLSTRPVLMISAAAMKDMTTSMDSSRATTIRAMIVGVLGLLYWLAVKEFKLISHHMTIQHIIRCLCYSSSV